MSFSDPDPDPDPSGGVAVFRSGLCVAGVRGCRSRGCGGQHRGLPRAVSQTLTPTAKDLPTGQQLHKKPVFPAPAYADGGV